MGKKYMKKLITLIFMASLWSVLIVGNVSADCGELIEGKWNVKKADDIKKHVLHRLKIEKTGNGKYSVKIKNDKGDTKFKSAGDFSLSCSNDSTSATLSGNVKMGNCMHAMEVGAPYEGSSDNIYIKFTTGHEKGECAGHKDTMHEKDARKHIQVAYGKRAGK
jgi:hypothetical protein